MEYGKPRAKRTNRRDCAMGLSGRKGPRPIGRDGLISTW